MIHFLESDSKLKTPLPIIPIRKKTLEENSASLYCIVFAARTEPKEYDEAQVLEASGRLMLVIGRS